MATAGRWSQTRIFSWDELWDAEEFPNGCKVQTATTAQVWRRTATALGSETAGTTEWESMGVTAA